MRARLVKVDLTAELELNELELRLLHHYASFGRTGAEIMHKHLSSDYSIEQIQHVLKEIHSLASTLLRNASEMRTNFKVDKDFKYRTGAEEPK